MFEMTTYTVHENNRSVPLCIDVGAINAMNKIFTITAKQNNLTQAEGGFEWPMRST